jgi:hypothetical protein
MLAKSCHSGRQTTPNDAKSVPALVIANIYFYLFFSSLVNI